MNKILIARRLVMLMIALAAVQVPAKTTLPEILGAWSYAGLIYRGQRMEPPNPHLHIVSMFTETGLNHLFYWRDDEPGFCERRAIWWYDEKTKMVSQTIVAANPKNRDDCAKDPDMQVGRTTWTPVSLSEGELRLTIPLGDETVQYFWKRLEDTYGPPAAD